MSDLNEEKLDRRGRRAAFALLLALGMAFSTIASFALPALAPFLVDDLGLSRSQIGSFTAVFYLVATLGSIPSGRLVDARGGRIILIATFVISSITLGAIAAAPSYVWILIAVMFAGTLNATCNPVTNKLIVSHIPPGKRGLVTGVKQAGVQMGAFFAAALLPAVATVTGWRGSVGLLAVVPVIGVVSTFRLVPPDEPGHQLSTHGPPRAVLTPGIIWLALYGFLMGAATSSVFSYLPLYGHEELGLSPPTAGLVASLVGLTAAAAGILWARASEHFGSPSTALVLIALLSLGPIALFLLAPTVGPWSLFPAAILFGGTAAAWNATGMLAVMATVGPEGAGQASGLVLTGFFGGFVAAPVLFGLSVDLAGTYGWGWGAVLIVPATAAVAALVWGRESSVNHPSLKAAVAGSHPSPPER
jgi:predicted MFS family arabinose efflux permease